MNSWLELISECELCGGSGDSSGTYTTGGHSNGAAFLASCQACDGTGVISNPLSIAELARLITRAQGEIVKSNIDKLKALELKTQEGAE